MLDKSKLRGYQKRAYRFMRDNPESGLFLDMGLGKTIITLTALGELLDKGEVERVLMVGPLRVVQGVWRQEARKWEHTKHLTFKLLTGNEEKRLLALNSKAQIHLINVENLRWLLFVLKHLRRRKGFVFPYDTLVIDESSMFKTAGTKRFGTLRFELKHFQRRHIMTGTPAPNGLMDIWSQMFIVDQGETLGDTVGAYKSRFFHSGGWGGLGYEPDEDAQEKIAKLISPKILTMRAEDWLDLPPLVQNNVWVDLPPSVRTLYERMEREMFLELDALSTTAAHAGAVMAKCHQIANGALFMETATGAKTWKHIHDAKLDALKEVIEGTGSNMLVAYYFQHDLERLRKAFPKAPVVKDAKGDKALERLQKEWNDGRHRVMLIHPQGAGHGLNLQDGGHAITFFSLLFGHEAYRQVIERVGQARQVGKASRVLLNRILVKDTVDEALLAAQIRKYDNERGFIKAIQDYRVVKELLG